MAGTLRLADGSAVAGARVTAAAASDTQTVATDASGYFVFLSLPPDTYTVTSSKSGFDTVSVSRVRVLADNTRIIALGTRKTVVLGVVKVKIGGDLLRPGVVADVYSVDQEQAEKVQLLSGGANVDNIYSALSAIPGVIVPFGQGGAFHPFGAGAQQNVNIRGAGFEAVGYEYDGVPVNNLFNNQSALVGSKLGQRELQVYVGSAPANAEAFGLGGFINQVLKTGTYPGFASLDAKIQSPNYYNGLNLEVAGATPSRSFSYYVALGGYNTSLRYYDNFDGASQTAVYGSPLDVVACAKDPTRDSSVDCYQNNGVFGPFGPGGYILAPLTLFSPSVLIDRETVTNLHFRVPHHHSEGSDDVQILYSTSFAPTPVYSSYLDIGAGFWRQDAAAGGFLSRQPWDYFYGYQYRGKVGQPLPDACPPPCNVVPYSFPGSNAAPGSQIPLTSRDSYETGDGIVKIQYQHNIGSRAYLRLYGYSYYSWGSSNGPNSASACNGAGVGCESITSDGEFSTHTRGGSAAYAAQLSDKHLLNVEASFITATNLSVQNYQFLGSQPFAVLVDSKAPLSGLCFKLSGALGSCEPYSNNPADFQDLGAVNSSGVTSIAGKTCDPGVAGAPAGPCQWLVVESGPTGPYSTVRPGFTSLSIGDQFRASSKLQLTGGIRFDRFVFAGGDTNRPAREFWFNAWNQNECVASAPGSLPKDKAGDLGLSPAASCLQLGMLPATMYNASGQDFSYSLLEPRLGGTYTLNDDDVLRLSYAELAQPPQAANEQFDVLQQNLPAALLNFYPFGFTTPGHALGPSVAYSLDLSWEHRLRKSDLEFKLTPYVRKTNDQYEGFTLNARLGIFAELPAARQTSEGLEFELQKGDFQKSGLSWMVTYTYFHNVIGYTPLPSGATFQTASNNQIRLYNAYTSFCAGNPTDPRCGLPTNGALAARCYDASGAAAPACPPGDIANPYWKAPVQSLIPDTSFPTFNRDHVAQFVLNYKTGRLAVTPTLQFFGGFRYGDPLVAQGVDPASSCTALGGSTAGDPRYPYGAQGGSPYDATSCHGQINIPDPYTRIFDGINTFVSPAYLGMNLQVTYDATSRVQFVAGAANLINVCWPGSKEPWTIGATKHTCFYFTDFFVGNFYNPNSYIQPFARSPYFRFPGATPIVLTFWAKLKV